MTHFLILFSLVLAVFQNRQPAFKSQVIDDRIAIGYGLAVGDVDGDRKPDILLADKKQFVWYRNGDWKRFVMIDSLTSSDNVCIAARDIDHDGLVEVAVGAQWNPSETADTTRSGSVHFLVRPEDPTKIWTAVKLHHEPTVHRMKWVQVGKNRYVLVVLPLHGRGNKNGQGEPVKVMAYERPVNPKDKWSYTIIDQSMHLTHNFDVFVQGSSSEGVLIGGKEGVKSLTFSSHRTLSVSSAFIVKDRSFGEVRVLSPSDPTVFTGIEPMHGNTLGVYSPQSAMVLTSDLHQGHALAAADFLKTGQPQIVAGWREPNDEHKVGLKIFVAEPDGKTWKTYWIDDNDMACEDLQVADLDGDGKKDIVAAGRATHNLKIYWNKTVN